MSLIFLRRLLANRSFTIGLALVGVVVLMALLANLIAPFDPLKGNFKARMVPPSAEHWLGTDHFGRDILSRILHGAQVSLRIGFLVALLTALAGAVIGAAAGYFRHADGPVMRLMDAFMAFPPIILAIAISSVLGASVTNVVIALAIAATPHTARVVRASVMVVREMEYVEAARALGAGHARILLRHVLAAPPLQQAALLGLMGISGLAGNVLLTRSISRIGPDRGARLALALVASGLLLWTLVSLLAPTLAGMAVVVVVWGSGSFAFVSAQQARLGSSAPALASASIALNSSSLYAGQALGATAGGALLATLGYGALAPAGLLTAGLALLLCVRADRPGAADRPQPSPA